MLVVAVVELNQAVLLVMVDSVAVVMELVHLLQVVTMLHSMVLVAVVV